MTALFCSNCGQPLTGDLDTFGPVGEEHCAACFSLSNYDETTYIDDERIGIAFIDNPELDEYELSLLEEEMGWDHMEAENPNDYL